jgi:uncharacterized membrane protein YjdF
MSRRGYASIDELLADMFAPEPSEWGETYLNHLWMAARSRYRCLAAWAPEEISREEANAVLRRYKHGLDKAAQCPICLGFLGHSAIYHCLPWCKACSRLELRNISGGRRWAGRG